jgi:hypothetical protein
MHPHHLRPTCPLVHRAVALPCYASRRCLGCCTTTMPGVKSSTTSPVLCPCWNRARASSRPPPSCPHRRIDPPAEHRVLCTFLPRGRFGAVSPLQLSLDKCIRTMQRSCASHHRLLSLAASTSACKVCACTAPLYHVERSLASACTVPEPSHPPSADATQELVLFLVQQHVPGALLVALDQAKYTFELVVNRRHHATRCHR